jgi:hypothetical protein
LSEVKDLVSAIQKPLAVFRSATHIGSNVILTELKHDGKNFVVAIETNRQAGKINVNSIRSIHPRTTSNVIEWINEDLMDYADKEGLTAWVLDKIKSRHYLNSSDPADVRKRLLSAANKIKSFENPKQNDGNLRLRTSEELDRDYPNWNDTQTTSKGGHSTQITGTVSTSV